MATVPTLREWMADQISKKCEEMGVCPWYWSDVYQLLMMLLVYAEFRRQAFKIDNTTEGFVLSLLSRYPDYLRHWRDMYTKEQGA